MERDLDKKLFGFIELDDAYLGRERTGCKRGCGTADKTSIVTAVETISERIPVRVELSVVKGFGASEIMLWSQQHLSEDCFAISGGLTCFNAVTHAGCGHDKIDCGGGRASVEEPEFYWVNTILGNLKSSLRSTFHAVRPRYAQRYLFEFQYRFNRRISLPDLRPRLACAALRTPPMPDSLLKHSLA